MILSAQTIRRLKLVDPLHEAHKDVFGNSVGLSACGYDLSIDQDVTIGPGEFMLASTVERFALHDNIVAIIHDKSSLARVGLAVQNTVAEPGWRGYLTLELTNHSRAKIYLREGCAICQAIFHYLDEPTELPYAGKYQDQERGPQAARIEKGEL